MDRTEALSANSQVPSAFSLEAVLQPFIRHRTFGSEESQKRWKHTKFSPLSCSLRGFAREVVGGGWQIPYVYLTTESTRPVNKDKPTAKSKPHHE